MSLASCHLEALLLAQWQGCCLGCGVRLQISTLLRPLQEPHALGSPLLYYLNSQYLNLGKNNFMLSFFCFSLKLKVCSLGQIFLHQKQIGMKTNLLDDRLMVGAIYLSNGLSLWHSSFGEQSLQ